MTTTTGGESAPDLTDASAALRNAAAWIDVAVNEIDGFRPRVASRLRLRAARLRRLSESIATYKGA